LWAEKTLWARPIFAKALYTWGLLVCHEKIPSTKKEWFWSKHLFSGYSCWKFLLSKVLNQSFASCPQLLALFF